MSDDRLEERKLFLNAAWRWFLVCYFAFRSQLTEDWFCGRMLSQLSTQPWSRDVFMLIRAFIFSFPLCCWSKPRSNHVRFILLKDSSTVGSFFGYLAFHTLDPLPTGESTGARARDRILLKVDWFLGLTESRPRWGTLESKVWKQTSGPSSDNKKRESRRRPETIAFH